MRIKRPIAFTLASTNHGSMLVNRFDFHKTKQVTYGVGYQILESSEFDAQEVDLAIKLLGSRKDNFGENVIAIDCGANIGVHTIEWAKAMFGWGKVISIEAQERIYYALAGNIAINNCFNASAIYAAVGAVDGFIYVPEPDYMMPGSFGSLEIQNKNNNEFIGQTIDYSEEKCTKTKMIAIDSLNLERLDFIKIDIEGMEVDALRGAESSLRKFKPQMLVEKIKSNEVQILEILDKLEYKVFSYGNNLIAIHNTDPALKILI